MNTVYDLLKHQITRAEALLRQLKCPWPASYENIHWNKDTGTWRIMCDGKPLADCPAAIRIEAVSLIPGLRGTIVAAKAEALTAVGQAAQQLSDYLDTLEEEKV